MVMRNCHGFQIPLCVGAGARASRGRSGDLLACSVERHPRLLVRVTAYTSVQRIQFIEFSSKNLVHQYLRGGSRMFILTGVK